MKFTIRLMAHFTPKKLAPEMGITSIKDPITEDVQYTSDKMIQLNEERKMSFNHTKNNMFTVFNAIKMNPYLNQ